MAITLTVDETTLTLPSPNSFSFGYIRQGAYTKTLDGTLRRAINSDKEQYVLGYSKMSTNDFSSIKTLYDLREVATFVFGDLNIDKTVHIDISNREFVPGNPGYYSSVEITLQEV